MKNATNFKRVCFIFILRSIKLKIQSSWTNQGKFLPNATKYTTKLDEKILWSKAEQ